MNFNLSAIGLVERMMNSASISMKTRGFSFKWLVIAAALLLSAWCSRCTLGAPLPLADSSKPSKEVVDSVTYETALVRQY